MRVLQSGRSVILYTALGPGADRGVEIDSSLAPAIGSGSGLGDILKRLVLEAGLRRAVIAGGDTSSHALGRLGVDALTVRMPLPQYAGFAALHCTRCFAGDRWSGGRDEGRPDRSR